MMLWLAQVALGGTTFVDAIELEVGDHSTAFPFGNMSPVAPLHPAITLGAQHLWVDQRFDVVQTLRAGGHLHPTAGNALRLGTDLDLRWASGVGPVLEAGLSLGLHHVIRQRPVLVFDSDSGTYAERRGIGRPNLAMGAGVALGFDLGDLTEAPVTLLVDYHWLAQTGWLPALPVGPQGTLSLGIRVAMGRSE